MHPPQLKATKRTKRVNHVRAAQSIPAVLYGHGVASESLALPYNAFASVYGQAGGSTLVDVIVEDASPRKALIHDVQQDPVTGRFLHVDLYQVRMTEKMKTKVPLRFTGESPAVKEKGGLLVKVLDHVHIACLPQDLVHEIPVAISGLTAFGQSIYVRDLVAPAGITILEKLEEPVVTVMRPKTDEELTKELAETTAAVKVEEVVKVQEKGKKEEEDIEAGASGEKGAPKATEKSGAKPQHAKEKK